MKKILVLMMGALCFLSCSIEPNIDDVKQSIVETEKANIPLRIQEFDGVFGIQIDSIVLTNNTQPYTGYLVTTWDVNEKQDLSVQQWAANGYKDKYVRKSKKAYVPIETMTISVGIKSSVSWNSDWRSVYYDIRKENKRF